jgi:uncharacterized membrane protein YidH (DUF202 family)
VIVVATASPGTCSQGDTSGSADSVTAVFFILGPLSILAIFASIFTWSREQRATRGGDHLTSFAQALIGAVTWGAAGYFVVFLIALDKSGCLR